MLTTAPCAKGVDLDLVSWVLFGAMVGPVRHLLETDAPPRFVAKVREQLVLLVDAHLSAALPGSMK